MRKAYEVVVITGASAGLGRACAQEFARHGARIGLLARDANALLETAAEVEALGGTALMLPLDVADAAQVEAAAARVEAELGPIDVWVNNAMATIYAPFAELEPEEFRRVTDVTYHGYVWGTMAALKRMRERDRGVVIQVGSALAYRSIPLQSAYCGAKFAIRGFTDALRSELIHAGSRVHLTMVQMPALDTPQFDWGRNKMPRLPQPVPPVFAPELGARAVEWSARHRRRELIVGGPSWQAIWGSKFIPGWLDRYLAEQAWSGQQRPERTPPRQPDNLWRSVPGGHATHGSFTREARRHSLQLCLTTQRTWLLLGVAALGGAVVRRLIRDKDRGSGAFTKGQRPWHRRT